MLSDSTKHPLTKWLRICLFNLWIVSSLGLILRSKILFSLPFIDQQYFLHGHSHFAFAGWITQILMVLLVEYLSRKTGENKFVKYDKILYANLFTAYGMLISFPLQGYGLYAILFSTLSIFAAYVFGICFWRDLNFLVLKPAAHKWFKAAIAFNFLSSLGTFFLAYMMASKVSHQHWYLASIYFYLHFQYNGWFFFVCMGLLYDRLEFSGMPRTSLNPVFWVFAFCCIPAYFLSALWLPIPFLVYIVVIISAIAEAVAWLWLLRLLYKNFTAITAGFSSLSKWLLSLSALALTIKLLLQMASTIPSLSHMAYGFRPIVIAYLHLVLLGMITLFILGYAFAMDFLHMNKTAIAGTIIFCTGILLNEVILMLQGIEAIMYIRFPLTNEILFSIAIILFAGIGVLFASQKHKQTAV
jgi:hypothetical protein